MESGNRTRQPRLLTQDVFASFLRWLSEDTNLAGNAYLEIRSSLVKYFVRKGCAQAEDLTDETVDRVAHIVHVDPEKYPTPLALCCGVARRVWLESLRKAIPSVVETESIPQAIQFEGDFSEDEFRCLDSCMQKLPMQDRALIMEYHRFQGREKIEIRKRLAETCGGLNRLRINTCRIRSRLHDCINTCTGRSHFNAHVSNTGAL